MQKLHQSEAAVAEAAAAAAAAAAVAVTAAVAAAAAEASHFNCKTKLPSLPRQLLVTVCQYYSSCTISFNIHLVH